MIELRWIHRERAVDAFVIEGSISPTYPVLQYRQTYLSPRGDLWSWKNLFKNAWIVKWGQWRDVPTETKP